MPKKSNLDIAIDAIEYVKEALPYGSDNREEDKHDIKKYQEAKKRIANIENAMAMISNADSFDYSMAFRYEEDINSREKFALKEQAGNCDDQAAVCFKYLERNTELRPLSLIHVSTDSNSRGIPLK